MEVYLASISSCTLGVWKALLMPRPQRTDEALQGAVAAAASGLAQRHFEADVDGDGGFAQGAAVLCEILELLVLGWGELGQEQAPGTGCPSGEDRREPVSFALGALFPSAGRMSTRREQLVELAADIEEQHRRIVIGSGRLGGNGKGAPGGTEDVGGGCLLGHHGLEMSFGPPGGSFRDKSASLSISVHPEVSRREVAAPAVVKRTSRLAGLTTKQQPPAALVSTTATAMPPQVPKGRGAAPRGGAKAASAAASTAPAASSVAVAAAAPVRGRKKAVPEDRREAACETATAWGAADPHASRADSHAAASGKPSSGCSSCGGSVTIPSGVELPSSGGGVHRSAPVLLVLGPTLHAIPWESIPGLRGGELYRSPSLALSCLSAERLRKRPAAAASLPLPPPPPHRRGPDDHPRVESSVADEPGVDLPSVDLRSTCYALNPGGDLVDTQRCFEEWFGRTLGWQVREAILAHITNLLPTG